MEFTKRFSKGWTWQGNWAYSKALGEEEGNGEGMIDSYRDLRNRALDKRLLGSRRTGARQENEIGLRPPPSVVSAVRKSPRIAHYACSNESRGSCLRQ